MPTMRCSSAVLESRLAIGGHYVQPCATSAIQFSQVGEVFGSLGGHINFPLLSFESKLDS